MRCRMIDTFPSFLAYWDGVRHQPVDMQIELWLTEYMAQWPELRDKQIEDYTKHGYDWRQVAKEHTFPFIPERLPKIVEAGRNLPVCADRIFHAARGSLGLDFDVSFVSYVGISGAGWATRYEGAPAVLFGLEAVAGLNWHGEDALAGVAAHELGHLVHVHRREGLSPPGGPFAGLYDEGFATRCEYVTLGRASWYIRNYHEDDWETWCTENRAWLAGEFLRLVDEGESLNVFFGDWFSIRGHSQCGYFLGHEVIKDWEHEADLMEIAVLPGEEIERRARESLEKMAKESVREG